MVYIASGMRRQKAKVEDEAVAANGQA
jgi:hypothetical protein